MAFNISSFSSNIGRYGVLQNNKFAVFFMPPLPVSLNTFTDIGDIYNTFNTTRMIQMRTESARIPGVSIQSQDVKRYGTGVSQKMPHNAAFTDTSFTFVADRDSTIHRFFYAWLTNIVDFNGTTFFRNVPSYNVAYKDDIMTDIYIFVFDNSGNVSQLVTLYDAFPNSMNDVALDWGNTDTVMKITVGFTFREWSLNNVNSGIAGGLDFLVSAATSFFAQDTSYIMPSGMTETRDASAEISGGIV